MATTKRRRRHAREKQLPDNQRLALLVGPADPNVFESTVATRVAWFEHRESLMADISGPFIRPWGFWEFEGKAKHPRLRDAQTALIELGLPLTPEEMAIIKKEK